MEKSYYSQEQVELAKKMNMVGVERQSSIEKEPRTLNNNQIYFAREAALYVVNTRSIHEALTIFTEGLEPVETCTGDGDGSDDGEMPSVGNAESDQIHEKINNVKDIVSAPF